MHGKYITLNSTVLYSLNTTSRAPANYNPPPYRAGQGPGYPKPNDPWGQSSAYYPRTISDTLLIYHNGHETASCTPNYDGVVDHFNQIGYDGNLAPTSHPEGGLGIPNSNRI